MSPSKSSTGGFGPKKAYLILYNAASAIAWGTILGRVAFVLQLRGAHLVPVVVDSFARITQTFAIMEVLHALTGSFLPIREYFAVRKTK